MAENEANLFHSYIRFDRENGIDHPITRGGIEDMRTKFTILEGAEITMTVWRKQLPSERRKARPREKEGNTKGINGDCDATNLVAKHSDGDRRRESRHAREREREK
jgi:hypothetical protein